MNIQTIKKVLGFPKDVVIHTRPDIINALLHWRLLVVKARLNNDVETETLLNQAKAELKIKLARTSYPRCIVCNIIIGSGQRCQMHRIDGKGKRLALAKKPLIKLT